MQSNLTPTDLEAQLTTLAQQQGARRIGICSLEQDQALGYLDQWLERDFFGEMEWMRRGRDLRADLNQVHPNARRIVIAAFDYWPEGADAWDIIASTDKAYISRYALGRDYHKTLRKRMKSIAQALLPGGAFRVFSDSAPVLEKHFAEQSGLGWIGKHTLILSRSQGSYCFLAGFLTDAELPTTTAIETPRCGSCTACIEVCPTQAIVAPYQLDARKCISYHTIEMDAPIPEPYRVAMGNRVFGCDDCQLVCPWNRYAELGDGQFTPRHGWDDVTLLELWALTEDEFLKRTEGMAIRRAGYVKFRSNLAIALGNTPYQPAHLQALQSEDSSDPRLKEHVAWAIDQQRKKCAR